jgi:hypothetical protein
MLSYVHDTKRCLAAAPLYTPLHPLNLSMVESSALDALVVLASASLMTRRRKKTTGSIISSSPEDPLFPPRAICHSNKQNGILPRRRDSSSLAECRELWLAQRKSLPSTKRNSPLPGRSFNLFEKLGRHDTTTLSIDTDSSEDGSGESDTELTSRRRRPKRRKLTHY